MGAPDRRERSRPSLGEQLGSEGLVARGPELQRNLAPVEVVERPEDFRLSAPPGDLEGSDRPRRSSVFIGDQPSAEVAELDRSSGDAAFASWTRLRSPWAPTSNLS